MRSRLKLKFDTMYLISVYIRNLQRFLKHQLKFFKRFLNTNVFIPLQRK